MDMSQSSTDLVNNGSPLDNEVTPVIEDDNTAINDINITAIHQKGPIYCYYWLYKKFENRWTDINYLLSVLDHIHTTATWYIYSECLMNVVYQGICQGHDVSELLVSIDIDHTYVLDGIVFFITLDDIIECMLFHDKIILYQSCVIDYLFDMRHTLPFNMNDLLLCTIHYHHHDAVKKIIETGIDVNRSDLFYEAANVKNTEAIKLLFDHGFVFSQHRINIKACVQNIAILKLLVAYDCDLGQNITLTVKQQELYQFFTQLERDGTDSKKILIHHLTADK